MNAFCEPPSASSPSEATQPVAALVESLLRWEDTEDHQAIQDALEQLDRLAQSPRLRDDADLAEAIRLGSQVLRAVQRGQAHDHPASIDTLLELAQCLSEILQSSSRTRSIQVQPVAERLETLLAAAAPSSGAVGESQAGSSPSVSAGPEPGRGLSAELVAQFKTEAYENLEQVERALLVLDKSPQDKGALDEAFRGIHNIKGAARYVGLNQLGALAHAIEDILDQSRAARRHWEPALADLVFRAVDELRQMTDALQGDEEPPRDLGSLMAQLRQAGAGVQAPPASADQSASQSSPAEVLRRSAEQQLDAITGCIERLLAGQASDTVLAALERAAGTLDAAGRALGDAPLADAAGRLRQHVRRLAEQRTALRQQASAVADDPTRAALLQVLQGDASEASLAALRRARPAVQSALDAFQSQQAQHAAQWGHRHPSSGSGAATSAGTGQASSPPGTAETPPARPASASPARSAKPEVPPRTGRDDPGPRSIRVDQRKLDDYINLAGELVIARNALAHEFRQAGLNPAQHRRLKESIERVDRIVADIQANAMSMRMVPVATLFQRFPRMLRDIARSLDKQIELRTVGEDTELDKQVAERLADPLVHLVRNAADHGIETPEVRRAAGKPETGTITLRAAREGGSIVLEVLDDGAGIPAERLKAKAVEKGLITPAQAAAMSRDEALQLVFAAGLSTAPAVSDLSGRGVGMDVVRNNLAELGGTVAVFSEPGQGTRFRLELPLTLAVTNVLLAGLDDATYAIPVDAVQETLKVALAQLQRVNQQWVISLRGKTVPIQPLKTLLGPHCRRAYASGNGSGVARHVSAATPHARQSEQRPVLVVRRGGSPYGLMVDRLLGQQEIVIKPLPGHLARAPGVSGAAILGDGQVALILDPARLGT